MCSSSPFYMYNWYWCDLVLFTFSWVNTLDNIFSECDTNYYEASIVVTVVQTMCVSYDCYRFVMCIVKCSEFVLFTFCGSKLTDVLSLVHNDTGAVSGVSVIRMSNFSLIKFYSWCQIFRQSDYNTAWQCNAGIEIKSIPTSPDARDAILVPVSFLNIQLACT